MGSGEKEILKKVMELEKKEERLKTFMVDVMDYHSILEALRGCCALFCCLDNANGYYDVNKKEINSLPSLPFNVLV